jgi:hypothetical protein
MTEHEASRTLVKSPPELWAECSSAEALSRHLNGSFGEIRITRLEPETAVAWEGELASGTVRLEPSGWGTKVIITARPEDAAAPVAVAVAEPEAVLEPGPEPGARAVVRPGPDPVAVEKPESEVVAELPPEPEPAIEPAVADAPAEPAKLGFFGRMKVMFGGGRATLTEPVTEPEAVAEPVQVAEPAQVAEPEAEAVGEAEPEPETEPEPQAGADPEPEAGADPAPDCEASVDPEVVLTAALDSLGQAHHRPFSRT